MEPIREIEVQRLFESNALSVSGTGRSLSDAELDHFGQLCRQMQAYYPHQEFGPDTVDGFLFDLERLAVMYGIDRLEKVLLNIRIKPGHIFFPHPSEVSQALEELMANEKAAARAANPFTACGKCSDGMLLEFRDGQRVAKFCECVAEWKRKAREVAA
jgi:hypothetical protein